MPSGCKPGERRGGRAAGTKNRSTIAHLELAEAMLASGLRPLEYMLDRLRDVTEDPKIRREMAVAAAPYMHPKMSAIEVSGPAKGPIVIDSTLSPAEAYALIVQGGLLSQ